MSELDPLVPEFRKPSGVRAQVGRSWVSELKKLVGCCARAKEAVWCPSLGLGNSLVSKLSPMVPGLRKLFGARA